MQEEAELAQQLQMEERAARQEGLSALAEDLKDEMRAEAEARREAQAEEECRSVLEGLVSTVAEEELMHGLDEAIRGAADSSAEQAAALAEASEQQRTAHFTLQRNLSTLQVTQPQP